MSNKPEGYPATPELDRLRTVSAKSQAVGEFVDVFLAEKGIGLAVAHQHGANCYTEGYTKKEFQERYRPRKGDRRNQLSWLPDEIPESDWENGRHASPKCGLREDELMCVHTPLKKLLAEFFELDEKKMEAEREAVLEWHRKQHQP